MEKIKTFKFSNFLKILKCCLFGVIITLIGIVLLAVVLKFTDLKTSSISYVNNAIKGLAIFLMVLCIKKNNGEKLMLKAIASGTIYSLICFIIFSALNANFTFTLSFVYDLLFNVIVAVLVSIILNIITRKTI